uniref:Alternative protein ADAMTS20 n=1 Tax=Homo sapiens TaxID=9606 RepID=L0R6C0_HUMAN|nr:alternative protein ADAMTS20 [Homo sapiens]
MGLFYPLWRVASRGLVTLFSFLWPWKNNSTSFMHELPSAN